MPSKVAEILLEAARQQGEGIRERGAIWGRMAENLGQIPGQAMAQEQQRKQQALRARVTQQQLEVGGFELGEARRKAGQQTQLDALMGDPGIYDENGDFNRLALLERARGADPGLVPHVTEIMDKAEKAREDRRTREQAILTHELDTKGELADLLLSRKEGIDAPAFHLATVSLAKAGLLKPAEANQFLDLQTPEEIRPHLEAWRALSPKLRGETIAAKKAAEAPFTLTPGATRFGGSPDATGHAPVVATGGPDPHAAETSRHNLATETTSRLSVGRAEAGQRETERHNLAMEKLQIEKAEKGPDQNKLEQQYRTVLTRGLSSRSGGLGLEDGKVQQANHLLALMDQNYDPKTGQYTIPAVMQEELALGLARLTSPTGQVGVELAAKMNQPTAYGKMQGIISYVTGTPQTGSTQAVFKMFHDSIKQQGEVAHQNREGEMRYLRGLAPTELEESRRLQLEATSLNPLRLTRTIQNQKTGERKLQVSIDGGETWK